MEFNTQAGQQNNGDAAPQKPRRIRYDILMKNVRVLRRNPGTISRVNGWRLS